MRFAHLITATILTTLATAQAPTGPAPELAAYDRLLGSYEGTGQVWEGPDSQPSEWTATVHIEKVLGGHFIREHMVVEFGDAFPGSLVFMTFYGFDPVTRQHVTYGATNMGEIKRATVHWREDSMVTNYNTTRMGSPTLERWNMRLTDDGYTVHGEAAYGEDAWHDHVRGTYRRVAKELQPTAADASFMPDSTPAPMADLTALAGTYEVTGSMWMPGMPEMKLSGTHSIQPMWSGTLMLDRVHGKSAMGDYESWGVIGWDAQNQRYSVLGLDSMGQAGLADGWLTEDGLVLARTSVTMGVPSSDRTVLHCDGQGRIHRVTAHSMFGAEAPMKTFDAKYARR